ncbi:RNA-binding protein [Suicoccus acidiformans]|uniref:RNA-binding protein n=1 Tax=Suicoccus acidiformans TaxID=2036206 RepID=A0A347WNL8_9LACT|nr:S4 domain-containing protein YaaA [Suicoccus acidiformans]AXY26675.1 RNA-binding protein [Suicoccus acidiformans]
MEEKSVYIDTEFITLGQLLKLEDVIQSGGMAKWYLYEFAVYVNDELEDRRGRKIYPSDTVEIPNEEIILTVQAAEG